MDDVRVHDFFLAGDRDGYVRAARKHLHAAGEPPVNVAVASRWYGLSKLLFETDGDLWIHKDGDRLWWTISTAAEPSHEVVDEPEPRFGGKARSHLYHKPSTGWLDRSRTGAALRWAALHPKAQDFLATQATFMTLQAGNAAYAQALVEGADLSPWHDRPDWATRKLSAKRPHGTVFDTKRRTVASMAMRIMGTAGASGKASMVTRKNKECRFPSQAALETYIARLMEANEMICALTGLEMQFDDGEDVALRVSPDRIDSDGHYEPGNLQLVCRFVNGWKGDQPDGEFRRLLAMVRAIDDEPLTTSDQAGQRPDFPS